MIKNVVFCDNSYALWYAAYNNNYSIEMNIRVMFNDGMVKDIMVYAPPHGGFERSYEEIINTLINRFGEDVDAIVAIVMLNAKNVPMIEIY